MTTNFSIGTDGGEYRDWSLNAGGISGDVTGGVVSNVEVGLKLPASSGKHHADRMHGTLPDMATLFRQNEDG